MGPDLTGIGGRFSPRDLLESIIEPSKEISDQYQSVLVTRKDGETVTGRIANLNEETLMLTVDMMDPNGFANIKRKDIAMTSPVEMDYRGLFDPATGAQAKQDDMSWTMSFLYRTADLAPTGKDGSVVVSDRPQLEVLSVAKLISDAIDAVFEDSSVSEIFGGENLA